MRASCVISVVLLTAFCAAGLHAQRSFGEHNSAMASLQPAFITPLVAPDPRLLQYARLSVSHEYTAAGAETVNYGNGRGAGIIAGNRFEFDFVPPPYIQHNSTADDGFGDTSVTGKVSHRVWGCGERQLRHRRSPQSLFRNRQLQKRRGHRLVQPGYHRRVRLPASIRRDLIARRHAAYRQNLPSREGPSRGTLWRRHMPLRMSGSRWRTTQPFISRAATTARCRTSSLLRTFYVVRPKAWKPTHPFFIIDGGMQIATSGFHTYNHNLITEARVLF